MQAAQFYGSKGPSTYERVLDTPYKTTGDSGSETDSDFEEKKCKTEVMEVMDIASSNDEAEEIKQEQKEKPKTMLWLNPIPATIYKGKTPPPKKTASPDKNKKTLRSDSASSVSSVKSSTSRMSRMGVPRRRAHSPSRLSSNTHSTHLSSSSKSASHGLSVAALARQIPGQNNNNNNTEKNSNGYGQLPITRSKISPPPTSPSQDTESQMYLQSEFYKSAFQSAVHSPSSSLRSKGDKSSLIHESSLISHSRNRKTSSNSSSNNSNDFHDSKKSPARFLNKSKTVAAGSNFSKDSSSSSEDDQLILFSTQKSSTSSNRLHKNNNAGQIQQPRRRQREEIKSPVMPSKFPKSLDIFRLPEEDEEPDGNAGMLIRENDSFRQELERVALRSEKNKINNLENLTFENMFNHFLKKYSNIREGASKDKLPLESIGVLSEFMKKDETFLKIRNELEKIRSDMNLLENKHIDDLFDLVMKNMQNVVQEEFERVYRGWAGCIYLFSV